MKFSYLELIKKSFEIAWKNKFFWILGIFASLFNSFEILKFLDGFSSREFILGVWRFITVDLSFNNLSSLYLNSVWSLIFFIVLLFLFVSVGIFFIWLSINSQIALITNISKINKGSITNLIDSFKKPNKNFWDVIKLHFGAKFIVMIFGITITIPSLAFYWLNDRYAQLVSSSFSIVLMILFLFLSLFIYFIVLYAINFCILKKNSLKEALKNSIDLFTKNIAITLETATVLLFISFLISKISAIIFKIIIVNIVVLVGISNDFFSMILGPILMIGAICIIFAFIGFITTFQLAIWTLLFENLTKKSYISFLGNIFSEFKKK